VISPSIVLYLGSGRKTLIIKYPLDFEDRLAARQAKSNDRKQQNC